MFFNNFFEKNNAYFGGIFYIQYSYNLYINNNIFYMNYVVLTEEDLEMGVGIVYSFSAQVSQNSLIGFENKYLSGYAKTRGIIICKS